MSNTTKRRLAPWIAGGTAILLAMGACSTPTQPPTQTSNPSQTQSSTPSSAAPTPTAPWDTAKQDTISLSVMNNYYTAGWKEMANQYMALHPETKVTVNVVADNDAYFTLMTTWKSAADLSQASDIIHINFWGPTQTDYNTKVYDFTPVLDQPNPYNNNQPVRAALDPTALQAVASSSGGAFLQALPFDKVGVGVYYNKTLLAAKGLSVPTTVEEWEATCAALKAGGMAIPVSASGESSWYGGALADAMYRGTIYDQILFQPGDPGYDATKMAANAGFVFNESDLGSDRAVVPWGARIAAYQLKNGFNTPQNQTIWTEWARMAQYFTPNALQGSGTDPLTSFENQDSAFLVSGSWNAGIVNADMQQLGSAAFEWGSIPFPAYKTPPAGMQAELRTINVPGNVMGVLLTHPGDQDHLARVLDFYKFVYSPNGAQTMYTTTLAAGNYVQGPPAIIGVTLPQAITDALGGFATKPGTSQSAFALISGLHGQTILASDQNVFYDNVNKLDTGAITAEQFLTTMEPYFLKRTQDDIATNKFPVDSSGNITKS